MVTKKPSGKTGGSGGQRTEKTRVKTAKGRKLSSTRWLERQLNDPYVQRAQKEGYRSRAAYKLIELNEKFKLLKPGQHVVDLGAAPGGWSQVAAAITGADTGKVSPIIALDILAMDDLPGVNAIQLDFMLEAPGVLHDMLGGKVDVVLSDMAPNTIGHAGTDHIRIMAVVDAAYAFAREVLAPNGAFVAKVWQGGAQSELLHAMKKEFRVVKHAKPQASRQGSAEVYLVATGFKGKL